MLRTNNTCNTQASTARPPLTPLPISHLVCVLAPDMSRAGGPCCYGIFRVAAQPLVHAANHHSRIPSAGCWAGAGRPPAAGGPFPACPTTHNQAFRRARPPRASASHPASQLLGRRSTGAQLRLPGAPSRECCRPLSAVHPLPRKPRRRCRVCTSYAHPMHTGGACLMPG